MANIREVDFSSEGRGVGVVATAPIAKGEVVLREAALGVCDLPAHAATAAALQRKLEGATGVDLEATLLEAVIRHLAGPGRADFLNLCSDSKKPMFVEYLSAAAEVVEATLHGVGSFDEFATALAVVQENSFMDPVTQSVVVFPRGSRVNHACRDAANAEPHVEAGAIVFTARRDIKPAEEITIDYMNQENEAMGYLQRQEAVLELRGFECHCALCAAEAMSGLHLNADAAKVEEKITFSLALGMSEQALEALTTAVADGVVPKQSYLAVRVYRELRTYSELAGDWLAGAAFARKERDALSAATLSVPRAMLYEGLNIRRHVAKLPRLPDYDHLDPLPPAAALCGYDVAALPAPAQLFADAAALVRTLLPAGAANPVARLAAECMAGLGDAPPMPVPPAVEEEEEE